MLGNNEEAEKDHSGTRYSELANKKSEVDLPSDMLRSRAKLDLSVLPGWISILEESL